MIEKPSSVIWLKRLLFFRIGMALLVSVICIYTLLSNPENGFLTGFTSVVLLGIDVQNPYADPGFAIGYVTVKQLFPLILTGLLLVAINKRKHVLFWVFYILDLIISLVKGGPPIISAIIGTLGLLTTTQHYFKAAKNTVKID